MILTICLLLIIAMGIFIATKEGFEILGFLVCVLFGIYFIIHIIMMISVPYTFNSWVAERQSFVETLEESRRNGDSLESAATVKEVAEWNRSLAKNKYWNSTFMGDPYIDDRVEQLKPIK